MPREPANEPTTHPPQLLQDAELSGIFADSKTFVDKPTNGSLNSTLQAFAALGNNLTVGQMETFVEKYFVRRSRLVSSA